MIEELLEKIPPETRWAINVKILTSLIVMRGDKIIAPLLGTAKDIISPLWSKEKWTEINVKIFGDGANILFPMFKEMFNIPVEDAIGAVKLFNVAAILLKGPGQEGYNVEEAPERVVVRWPKCVWMERYNECEVDPVFIPCPEGHQAWNEEGLKAVNPKFYTYFYD